MAGQSIWRGSRSSRFASRKRTPDKQPTTVGDQRWARPVQARQDELAQLAPASRAGGPERQARRGRTDTSVPVLAASMMSSNSAAGLASCPADRHHCETRGNYRLLDYVSPWEKETLGMLVHCIPNATLARPWLLDRKDGPALGRKRAGIFEKLPEKSSSTNNLG